MSDFKLNWITEYIGDKKDLVIFDIGSHDFVDAINFKRSLPEASVYGFEASSKNYDRHSTNAINNNVKPFKIAISDTNGESIFYNSDTLGGREWTPSGSLLKPTDLLTNRISFDSGETVKTIRFDTFCIENNIKQVDVVHMDVQGAEHMVLNGLGDFRPKIIYAETCEYPNYEGSGSLEFLESYLFNMGYEAKEKLTYDTLYVKK